MGATQRTWENAPMRPDGQSKQPRSGSNGNHAVTRAGSGLGTDSVRLIIQSSRLICIATLALLAAACSRESPEAVTVVDEVAKRVLNRGLGADPDTLDPQLADDNTALAVIGDLCEGLTTEAPDGSIEPGAAQRWEVSADGREYRFALRRGLRWSNGDPLLAAHFAAGLGRAMRPDTQAPYAELLASVIAVEADDETTLSIRLSDPMPYLPAVLALPVATPLHPGKTGFEQPLCNGAFRLTDRQPGSLIELERNPHYRAADQVLIDRVRYLPIEDLTTELNLYRTGAIDVTSEVPNTQIAWLRENLPAELKISPYLSVYSYAVNLQRLADPRVRQALAMAIDRERIVAQVTGAGERPAYGWVPDGMPGYTARRFSWRSETHDARVASAGKAWQAAKAAGFAPGTLTLCTDASANHHRTAVALADMWKAALGVRTEIRELEWKFYLATRHAPGDCDLVRLGWSADFIAPEAFLAMFNSDHPQNTLGYINPGYDALMSQAAVATDETARLQALADAEALLLEDVPAIPIFFRSSKRLVKPQVKGYQDNPLGHLASRQLRIEQ